MLPNFSAQFLSFRAPEQSQEPYAGATGGVRCHDQPSPSNPMICIGRRRVRRNGVEYVGCFGIKNSESVVGENMALFVAFLSSPNR